MSSRTYLVFGSNDLRTWDDLGTAVAGDAEAALRAAQELDSGAHKHYGACPERNWSAATPTVTPRPPLVTWESISPKVEEEPKTNVDGFFAKPAEEKAGPQEDDVVSVSGATAEEADILTRAAAAVEKKRGAYDE